MRANFGRDMSVLELLCLNTFKLFYSFFKFGFRQPERKIPVEIKNFETFSPTYFCLMSDIYSSGFPGSWKNTECMYLWRYTVCIAF